MSDPFQLQTTFGSGLGRERPSLFGDQFQLRLDPDIEAQMAVLKMRLDLERIRSAWLQPNWLDLYQLTNGALTQPLSGGSGQTPPYLRYTPPTPSAPLVPRGNGPDQPRAGEVSDLLQAIWGIPVVQQAATRVTDQLTDDFWRRRSTGERVLVVSWGAMIGGGTVAGILGNRESRIWALNLINGKDIPVPGLDGFKFRLYSEQGTPTGAGVTIPLPRGITVSGSTQPRDTPEGRVQDYNFNVQLNLLEAIPALKARF